MQLHIKETTVSSAMVPVRWTLTKSEIHELSTRQVERPYVLLIVIDFKGREERYLSPVGDLVCYVTFFSSHSTLYGVIVWHEGASLTRLNAVLTSTTCGSFDTTLFDDERKWIDKSLAGKGIGIHMLGRTEPLPVTVPKEAFAKEPPSWIASWVNSMHDDLPRDQCQFRRRAMFAFTIQPIIAAALLLLALVGFAFKFLYALALLLYGYRAILWHNLVRLDEDIRDRYADDSKKYWLKDRWWLFPLTPLFVLVYLAVVSFAYKDQEPVLASWGQFGKMFGYYLIVMYANTMLAKAITFVAASIKRRMQRPATVRMPRYMKDAALVSDVSVSPSAGLASIPPDRRTVRLRFQALKARSCAPFSRH